MQRISLSQAFAQWQELAADVPKDDAPALAESWNDYTDSLCKDGALCDLQYHYCPAFDDEMPGDGSQFDPLSDDREFILDAMGVTLRATRKPAMRREGWDASASHWSVSIHRDGKAAQWTYSMGSAHTGSPELCDVLNSVMRDADAYENAQDVLDFAQEFGYGEAKAARAAYKACKESGEKLARLFSASELSDLRELFEDM